MTTKNQNSITFGAERLTIEDVVAISQGASANMNTDPAFTSKIDRGVAFLERLLKEEGVIYGVTTGYGDSCTVAIPPNLVDELPLHLTRFHGCGLVTPLLMIKRVLYWRLACVHCPRAYLA